MKIVLGVIMLLTLYGAAHAGDCEAVTDADQRNLCRAVKGHNPAQCESVSDVEQRNLCRALLR